MSYHTDHSLSLPCKILSSEPRCTICSVHSSSAQLYGSYSCLMCTPLSCPILFVSCYALPASLSWNDFIKSELLNVCLEIKFHLENKGYFQIDFKPKLPFVGNALSRIHHQRLCFSWLMSSLAMSSKIPVKWALGILGNWREKFRQNSDKDSTSTCLVCFILQLILVTSITGLGQAMLFTSYG